MKKTALYAFILVAFLCGSSLDTYACQCVFGGSVVCEDFWKARAVFVGTVIESKTVILKQDNYERHQRLVRLSIDEAFTGVEGPQVEILTGLGDSDCGFGFRTTQQYLVYAYETKDGQLKTSICTRTKQISKATEDLAYARGLTKAKPGGKLTVEVVRFDRGPDGVGRQAALAGIPVKISGPETDLNRTTDRSGTIVVTDLPAGDYEVSAAAPGGLTDAQSLRKIKLAERGCGLVHFSFVVDGRLNGRVVSATGLPIPRAEIFLIAADKEKYAGHWATSYSDENGNYNFDRIPAGRYTLITRFDGMTSQNRPFPTLYYPGVSERSEAKVFTISEGQRLENFELVMPPMPAEHTIEGVVVDPQGRAVTGARVGYASEGLTYRVEVDERGHFSFKAYEGTGLSMRASKELAPGK
ncbi:MAG TPA: carboxypeptidase regulatory-like domain-containing protein, partial [Pyrinomonadaceae bacterium]|nr:carboxypeptidase regulatory-like domain-containing protein [Pyrinomonadaceae bacterium]